MKQEILNIVPQSTIQPEKSKIEVLNIKYFYDLFVKKRLAKLYTPTLQQFKKIIYTFLKIYFQELYMHNVPKYFFLGGKMKLVAYHSWVKLQKRGYSKEPEIHRSDKAIGLFWYLKPSEKMHFMVKLKKLTGKTNAIPQIERIFNQNNDKDLLPIFTNEQKKGRIDKTLYKCIQS